MLWHEIRPLRWSEVSAPIKALRIVVMVSWLATLADFAALHFVRDVARAQPQLPDSVYRHQIIVGDAPHFITDEQNKIYAFAQPLALGVWSLTAATMILSTFLEYRLARKRKRQTIDRVLQENRV